MVRMEYGYSQIIQIMALYVPHIKKILISLQGIETQEGNPVFFEVYVRRNWVNTYCTLDVRTNEEGW